MLRIFAARGLVATELTNRPGHLWPRRPMKALRDRKGDLGMSWGAGWSTQ